MKTLRASLLGAALLSSVGASVVHAQIFTAGDLLVSSSTYQDVGQAANLQVGSTLPNGSKATANGTYPNVFNNETPDASFGVTSQIDINQITTTGQATSVNIAIPTSDLVTSFSSKSELSLNLSADGSAVTFMGYTPSTGAGTLDTSNSDTPGVSDSTNPVSTGTTPTYRAIGQLNADGSISVTDTNAYSGNNGRAAILASNGEYYTVGNAGNGTKNATGSVINPAETGVQEITPGSTPVTPASSSVGLSTSVGTYSVTQNGDAADKPAKDNNFRGETIFNNTLYVTKGSGSNGINTVYQVGSVGSLPSSGASSGTPSGNITILPGFSTVLASSTGAAANEVEHPFGLFFANATTLYVADEGTGTASDITKGNINGQSFAGLGKWTLNTQTNVWSLDYTMTLGLNIGQNYTVGGVSMATDGLRDLTGVVNPLTGEVSLYAITSTVGGLTDPGADPNKLVAINDLLDNTSATVGNAESFTTLETASAGQVLRGVSFTPQAVPEPSTTSLLLLVLAGGAIFQWKRQQSAKA
jgi:hypothetical protein